MTICKFFLQGNCRFGDNCKFEHQVSDHNYATSTSILLQNYGSKPAQTTSNVDTNTLVKSVVNDMSSAEKGGQWLLSSYAPFKEKPAFPGFEDHSMEEIRYLFYEAMRNGTVEQYKQNLQIMLQQAVMKIKALQNPSPEAVNMLKTIYNTTPASSFGSNQAPFNATPANSLFGAPPQQQKPVFGGTTSNPNVFSSSNASSNIFGSNQPQQNVFAGTSSTIFGSGQKSNSVFGGQQQTSPTKSIFGNPPQQTTNTNPIFGGGNTVFGGGTQPVFAGQPQFAQSSPYNQQAKHLPFTPPQQNIFQQSPNSQFGVLQNSNNQFATAQTSNNQFALAQTSNNQFAVPQAASGQFGGSQPATTVADDNKSPFQHSAAIFGNVGLQQTNPNVFGGAPDQPKPNEDFYSKLEELSEEDIKWFQNDDDLDVSKIPEKPPTYEMCFKM